MKNKILFIIVILMVFFLNSCFNKNDIYYSIDKEDIYLFNKIIIMNKNKLNIQDSKKDYPIFYCIKKKSIKMLSEIIKNDNNLNKLSLDNFNLLHYSYWHGNNEIIEFLLKKGINVESKDRAGRTLLLNTPDGDNIKLAELLIENGANINFQEKEDGFTTLILCGYFNSYNVTKLLLDNGVNIKIKNKEGYNAKEYSLKYGNKNIANLIDLYIK